VSIKNYNDTIGNRTRDLPVCSAVPQPTAPPRGPINGVYHYKIKVLCIIYIMWLADIFSFGLAPVYKILRTAGLNANGRVLYAMRQTR
jgi:hypothetical protein